jgi:hypothetical protein
MVKLIAGITKATLVGHGIKVIAVDHLMINAKNMTFVLDQIKINV